MKKLYIVAIVCLGIGFLIGLNQGPSKIEVDEKIKVKSETISKLNSKIKKLTEQNLKESVRTVIVEKPDGTKVTTKERVTEKRINVSEFSNKSKEVKKEEKSESSKKTVTTYGSDRNALGIRPFYRFGENIDYEAYLKAGMKCFIFNCYAEGSYEFINKTVRTSIGIEYRF